MSGGPEQEPGEEPDPRQPTEGRPVGQGRDEAERAEPDEQVREDPGAVAADGQRVDADLAEPAAGLHGREQGRERQHGPGLARPDPERASPARHRLSPSSGRLDRERPVQEGGQAVDFGGELGLRRRIASVRAGSRRSPALPRRQLPGALGHASVDDDDGRHPARDPIDPVVVGRIHDGHASGGGVR